MVKIVALSDASAAWSQSIGLDKDLSAIGFGTRTDRYALVLDDLKVKYVGVSTCLGCVSSNASLTFAPVG